MIDAHTKATRVRHGGGRWRNAAHGASHANLRANAGVGIDAHGPDVGEGATGPPPAVHARDRADVLGRDAR